MLNIVGIGAGGHAKVIIDILQCIGNYKIVGLTDPRQVLWGSEVLGVVVLGNDSILPKLYDEGIHYAFIGLGTTGNTNSRVLLYKRISEYGFEIINAIHPKSTISQSAKIGNGATIMAGAIINAAAKLGNNVIVNTGAIIEHDCIISDHVHIATGARLAGNVIIGEGTHVGLGAIIRQCTKIGSNVVIGAGAVVVDNIADGKTVIGNPAKNIGDDIHVREA